MVFLIGVNHKLQYIYNNPTISLMELVKSFALYLEEQAKHLKTTLIAEELNEEAISKNMNKAKDSTARSVADKLGIDHRFCDPETPERKALGIPSECEIRKELGLGRILNHEEVKTLDEEKAKYFSRREQFWFDKIKDKLHESIIFICGVDHVERFASLVFTMGHEVKILNKNWCKQE